MKQYILENRIFALIWRLLIVVAGIFGLVPMLSSAKSAQILCYFTMQSNIFVVALFGLLAFLTLKQIIKDGKHGEICHIPTWLQLAIIYFIQITFIVYATMLSNTIFSMASAMAFANILLHYIVPIMALVDWLLFMPHGTVKIKHAACWLTYPACYVVFAFIRAPLGKPFGDGSRYPYFFMDYDKLGLNIIWVCAIFFLGFFLLGGLLVVIDKAIYKKLNKQNQLVSE